MPNVCSEQNSWNINTCYKIDTSLALEKYLCSSRPLAYRSRSSLRNMCSISSHMNCLFISKDSIFIFAGMHLRSSCSLRSVLQNVLRLCDVDAFCICSCRSADKATSVWQQSEVERSRVWARRWGKWEDGEDELVCWTGSSTCSTVGMNSSS
jgi:hypothetical protein